MTARQPDSPSTASGHPHQSRQRPTHTMRLDSTSVGLLLGFALDRILGDPHRFHPVAGFGFLAAKLERQMYAPSRTRGVAYLAILTTAPLLTGAFAHHLTKHSRAARIALTATATWAVVGGRSLEREAHAVRARLAAQDLPGARTRVARLVGRDVAHLDTGAVARACIESVAENTSDAVVAPLLWGAVAGMPGLLAYRAVNTLDAMVGHRSRRYREFGWAAARFDDVVNWLPARLAAGITIVVAPSAGGSPAHAWRVIRADAHRHPSPNAGHVEAAWAGALGIQLGGVNTYRGTSDDRGTLGDGRPPEPRDITRATRLAALVGATSLAALLTARALTRSRGWR